MKYIAIMSKMIAMDQTRSTPAELVSGSNFAMRDIISVSRMIFTANFCVVLFLILLHVSSATLMAIVVNLRYKYNFHFTIYFEYRGEKCDFPLQVMLEKAMSVNECLGAHFNKKAT